MHVLVMQELIKLAHDNQLIFPVNTLNMYFYFF